MAFIGIITSTKNEEILKKNLAQTFNDHHIKHTIIVINEDNIQNIKNVKFDTVIMNEENNFMLNSHETLKKILEKTNFLILNSDMYHNLDLIYNLELTVITFGLNLKATITVSSIQQDNVYISQQRAIKNDKGNIIEPNETSLRTVNMDIYCSIICYIAVKLYK